METPMNITETQVQVPHSLYADDLHHHDSVTEASLCEALDPWEGQQAANADYLAELANERHFEDRGYWDAREQEDYEQRNGVLSFQDAWSEADPTHVPIYECHEPELDTLEPIDLWCPTNGQASISSSFDGVRFCPVCRQVDHKTLEDYYAAMLGDDADRLEIADFRPSFA
jgi:hypothetical protein